MGSGDDRHEPAAQRPPAIIVRPAGTMLAQSTACDPTPPTSFQIHDRPDDAENSA